MARDPGYPQRHSIRLRAFDYRTPGCYVVTMCTQHRVHLFGTIIDGEMRLTPSGQMMQETWDEIPTFYPNVEIDAFVVMPNHVHGIVVLPSTHADLYPNATVQNENPVGAPPRGRPLPSRNSAIPGNPGHEQSSTNSVSNPGLSNGQHGRPQGGAPTGSAARLSLFDVVERFKSLTTKRYGDGVRSDGWPAYPGKLWQRGYYERVVRNETELTKFRNYIENNPARWFEDPYRGE